MEVRKKGVGWSIINITTNEGEIEDWKLCNGLYWYRSVITESNG